MAVAFVGLSSGQAASKDHPSPITLDAALAQARASRPLLQAAERQLEAARRSRAAAGVAPSPTLFLGVTGKGDPTGGSEDLALVAPLDVFGRTSAARATGDAAVLTAEAELRRAQAEVQAEVLARFADTAAAEALWSVARTQNEINARLLDATRRRAEEGAVPGVQVQRARIEADRSGRTLLRREAEVRAARLRLAAAIGREGDVTVEPNAFPDLVRALPSEGSVVATPEILARSAEVRGTTADVRVARLLGRPELQLEVRRGPLYEGSNRVYPRLQLSLPLFDGGRARDERRAAEARRQGAEHALADARLLARAALEAARIEFAAAGQEVASFADTLDAARTLAERSEVGLREGAMTFTDALEATRALREVEEGLAEARRRLAGATLELLRAGGVILAPLGGEAGAGR